MTNDVILKYLKNENYDKLIKEIDDALQFDNYNPVYYYYRWLALNKGYLNADFNNLIDKEDLVKALDLDIMDVVDREYDFFKILPKEVRILFAYANYMDEEMVNRYISSSAIKDSKFFYDRNEVKPLYDYAMDLRIESQMKLTGKVVLSFIENRVYTTNEELKCKEMLEEIVKHFEDRLFITITNTPSRWEKTEELTTPIEEVKVDEVIITPNVEEVKVENPKEEAFEEVKVDNPKEKIIEEPVREIKTESVDNSYQSSTSNYYYYNTDYNYKKPEEKVSYSNYDNRPSPANGKIHFGVLFPFIFVGAWIVIVIFIINGGKNGNPPAAIVFLILYSLIGLVSLFMVSKRIKKGLAAIYLIGELALLVLAITFSCVNQPSRVQSGNSNYSDVIDNPTQMPTITCYTSGSRSNPSNGTGWLILGLVLDANYNGESIKEVKGSIYVIDDQGNESGQECNLVAASSQNVVLSFGGNTIKTCYFVVNTIFYSNYKTVDMLNIRGALSIRYNSGM